MIKIPAKAKGWIEIGRLGENEHRMVCFPETADVIKMYPDAVISVLHKRPSDSDAYPVSPEYVTIEDGMVCWLIQSGDLAETGRGQCEIVFVQDNVVAKTMIYETQILPALDGAETPPDPWQGWQEQVAQDAQRAEAAADLLEHPEAEAVTLQPGEQATASYEDGKFTFGIPTGQTGAPGAKGDPGNDYVITPTDYQEIADDVVRSQGLQKIVTDATDAANLARNWADGKNIDGTPSSQHYENNADHYRQLAAQSADAAEGSKNAIQNMTAVAVTLPAGSAATVTKTVDPETGAVTLSFGVPRGADGQTPTVPVQDVKMDGTSILVDGIANIPAASANGAGVVSIGSDYGIKKLSNVGTRITTSKADVSHIKAGDSQYRVIVPANQHESVFYALSKLAGVDLASGSDTVGVYPDNAKAAIQKMLGIYEAPWELIRADTFTNAESGNIEITVDNNGQPFELTDIILYLQIPSQENAVTIGNYGMVYFYYDTTMLRSTELGTLSLPANSSTRYAFTRIEQTNKMLFSDFNKWTTSGNATAIQRQASAYTTGSTPFSYLTNPYTFNKVAITSFTGSLNCRFYGKRKRTA